MRRHDSRDNTTVALARVPDLVWLNASLNGGLRPGAAYLLAGEPGANKSTLAVQVATALAAEGRRVLLALSEQTPQEVRGIFDRVNAAKDCGVADAVSQNVIFEPFEAPSDLLSVIRRRLPVCYPDTGLLVIDSLQGSGLTSTATARYREFFEFLDEAKSRGLATLTIAHVTKNNKIAGPKSLEHKVDVCLILRKAASLRHLYVVKNRFGPEVTEPITLINTAAGLALSPHRASESASVLGYVGEGDEVIEVQVAVSLPRYGARAEQNAPFLPIKRVRQIISTLCRLPGIDLNDLCYSINTFIPDTPGYQMAFDLPLAVAVLAAYLQQSIPPRSLFIGGVDLRRNIRPPNGAILAALAQALGPGSLMPVEHVYLSSAAAGLFLESLAGSGEGSAATGVQVVGVRTLDELLDILWPGLLVASQRV